MASALSSLSLFAARDTIQNNEPQGARPDPRNLLVVSALFLALTWLSVALRVWVRAIMLRSFGADDWLMIITLMVHTAASITIILISDHGSNSKTETLRSDMNVMNLIITDFGLYIATMLFLKLSLAVFFLRIVIRPWQKWTIWISMSIYGCFATAYWFVAIFQCGNPKYFLLHELTGQCLSFDNIVGPLGYAHASLNAATDWVFAVLPIFVLRLSQLPMRAMLPIIGLLVLAALGSISSCIRLAYIHDLAPNTQFYINAVQIGIWSIVEPGFCITAASLATLRPMFRCLGEKARYIMSSPTFSGGRSKRESAPPQNDFMSIMHNQHSQYAHPWNFKNGRDPPEHPQRLRTITSIMGNFQETDRVELKELDETHKSYGNMHSGRARGPIRQYDPETDEKQLESGSAYSFNKTSPTQSAESIPPSIPQRQPSKRSFRTNSDASRLFMEYSNRDMSVKDRDESHYNYLQNRTFWRGT